MVIPTIDYLMSAPLAALAAAPGIRLTATEISVPGFLGYVVKAHGQVVLALPAGRSPFERDCMVRYLIGHALNVDGLPPLPKPFRISELNDG